ncbi:MAG: regulatory protein RecX [Gammaproteobacteria bacterium]|nr:regulatory protein RecX [Gammaproteobacteria bacterium]
MRVSEIQPCESSGWADSERIESVVTTHSGVGLRLGTDEVDPDVQAVRNRALGLLARREHSVQELLRKLRSKGGAESVCLAVVEELTRLDLQSDGRFTEAYTHSRVGKGFGPMRIRQDLRQRGIKDGLIEDHLTRDAEYWMKIAEQARHKRFKGIVPDTRDVWNAQARFLAQRGFPSDLIYRVLGEQF